MNQSGEEKNRMCPHCEGDVALDLSECPYCGQAMDEPPKEQYRPPYESPSDLKLRESAPDTNVSDPFAEHKEEFARNSKPAVEPQKVEGKKQTLSILLLTLGGQILAIGLMLLFFSTDGHLTLEWSAKYWYIYCLIAVPLLVLGRFALNRFTPQESSSK